MSSPGRFAASPPRAGGMAHRLALQTAPVSRGASASVSSGAAGAPAPDARRDRPSPGLVVGLGDPVSDILVRLDDADLARRIDALDHYDVRVAPETNIFFVDLNVAAYPELNAKDVVQALRESDIVAIPWVGDSIRVVTHHDIPETAAGEIEEGFRAAATRLTGGR